MSVKKEKELKHSEKLKFSINEEIAKFPALWDRHSEEYKKKTSDKEPMWNEVTKPAKVDSKL